MPAHSSADADWSAELPDRPIDLHTHSTASDGTLSPSELLQVAGKRGLQILALTDHDTIDGIGEASRSAADSGVTLLPGVELSTTERGAEVHLLGYGVDVEDDDLRDELAKLAGARRRRAEIMIHKLRAAGYMLDGEAILAQANHGSIGRPHVARALIDIGAAANVDEAFQWFLTPGQTGWVPREPFTPEQAVSLLARHRAVPVLAHPYSTGDIDAVLDRLIPLGLKGIEVYYGAYSEHQRDELNHIAETANLIPTGGSDYHGPNFRSDRELGMASVPLASYEALVRTSGTG